jgi:hypothetical protein
MEKYLAQKKYYERNREKLKAKMREYSKNHKAELKAYYEKNKEKIKAKWREKHPLKPRKKRTLEEIKRRRHEYYIKNRVKAMKYNCNWQKENKDKVKVYRKANKLKKRHSKKNKARKWAEKNKERVLNNNPVCSVCGSKHDLEVHHKEYVNDINALEILCHPCHRLTHSDTLFRFFSNIP